MSAERPRNVRPVKPSLLKVGDVILHNGQEAAVIKIGYWRDSVHGIVYGLDLIVKGKPVRASFAESMRVDLLD